jgi:PAS domain S-box-containing protein
VGESRSSDASFRELIEIAPEPIGIIRDGRFVYANRAYAEALGYADPSDLRGLEIASLVSEEESAIRAQRESLILSSHKVGTHTYTVRRPDGTRVELEASSVRFEYEGKPAVLNMARDVTARNALERQVIQADRLAAIGTMAAGVAHEINNPLAYVLLNLDWAARTLRSAVYDASAIAGVIPVLEDARHGVEHVATIVRELKTFSRGDTERRIPVDVQAVAHSSIKIAAHAIGHRAVIRTAFEPAPLVWANDARLEQVVVNLLINAAQAMSRDGAGTANEIRVSVAPTDGRQVALEVHDNGEGIPPEVLPRIFDPFFTTKPVGVGTGLGLWICHGIITSIGGTIGAFSAPGEGTTIRVTLPVADLDSAVQPSCGQAEPPPAGLDHAAWAE